MLVMLKAPRSSIRTEAGVMIPNGTLGLLANDVDARHVAVQFYAGGGYVKVPKVWLIPAVEAGKRTRRVDGERRTA
jgi:hypothetical protein